MISQLQLPSGERLRTEAAIRSALGPDTNAWVFQLGIREEGIQLSPEGKLSWGSTKQAKPSEKKPYRAAIHGILSVQILAFAEKSAETSRTLWFPEPGFALVAAHAHFKAGGKISFALVTKENCQVNALCKSSRGPVVLPSAADLDAWIQQKLVQEAKSG